IDKSGAVQGAGAAESPSGQTAGAAASGTITDPTMLSSSSDASQWNGKKVEFTGVKVRRTAGDSIIILDGGSGQQIYVYNKSKAAEAKAGDLVNVKGTIKTSADTTLGQAAQDLAGAPYYIQADEVDVNNK